MSDQRAHNPVAASFMQNLPLLIGPLLWVAATVVWIIVHGSAGWERQALRNGLVYGVGVGSLISAFGHIVIADQVADSIGWPKGSPFQLEVGFANLSYGVLGIACAWLHGRFWLATIIGVGVFLVSAAAGHVRDMVRSHNFNPGNAGFIFWWDIILPVTLAILYSVQ